MAKRDAMDDIFEATGHKKPTKSLQETTEGTQKAYNLPTPGKLEPYRIRIPENYWKILTQYFEAQGMRPSEGIRQILREWMKEKGL